MPNASLSSTSFIHPGTPGPPPARRGRCSGDTAPCGGRPTTSSTPFSFPPFLLLRVVSLPIPLSNPATEGLQQQQQQQPPKTRRRRRRRKEKEKNTPRRRREREGGNHAAQGLHPLGPGPCPLSILPTGTYVVSLSHPTHPPTRPATSPGCLPASFCSQLSSLYTPPPPPPPVPLPCAPILGSSFPLPTSTQPHPPHPPTQPTHPPLSQLAGRLDRPDLQQDGKTQVGWVGGWMGGRVIERNERKGEGERKRRRRRRRRGGRGGRGGGFLGFRGGAGG